MEQVITGNYLCKTLGDALQSSQEKFQQSNQNFEKWDECYKEYIETIAFVINQEASAQDSLAYLAVGYAYMRLASYKRTPNEVKEDARQKAIYFIEKYLEQPEPSNLIKSMELFYSEFGELCEKEYEFEKAIKYYGFSREEFANRCKNSPIVRYEIAHGKKLKSLYWKSKDGEADFNYLYFRGAYLYLRIGTQYALNYWESEKNSPYYEEDSSFKDYVDCNLSEVKYRHDKGYIYKPQTKIEQAKFLKIAKEKGWR